MKKFYLYSLLTALLLLCSNVASAHDFEVNGVYYTIASSSAKTVAVTYSGSYADTVADEYSGIVTIPSTVTYNNVTYIVEGIGMSAFRGCTGVILVNISEGVKIIGESAFRDCSALASVTIPNSVTTIGTDAFYECSSLAKLNIPSSITSIGYGAFVNCTSLKRINITDLSAWCKIDFGDIGIVRSLTLFDLYLNGEKVTNLVIPSDITEIKKNTFQYCSGFTSVEIHNSVTSIGSGAFKYCSDLTNITIPESVTSIGDRAFYGCTGLTSVTIPNRVTSIGERAFYDCSGLTSVTIPNSVTTLGESAFYGCTSLTAVHITDLSAWCKINFVTYASANPLYDGANLYLNGEKVTNLVIPSDITEIKKYAFYGCSGLTDITFHDNVMLINQYAFYGCSGLTNVTIGSGVMVLGANAFETCSNLKCVTIPNSVISIGDNAFYGCSNLYTVIDYSDLGITKGSTDNGYVGYYATNIYTSGDDIPQDYIFETIDGVNTLVAYFGKSNDVVLPSNYNGGNYAIGDSVFYNSSITSIKIPNSVTIIGNSTFYGCTGLTSVTIPNSVTSIGNCTFYGCTGLTSITIPNSVTTIGINAFYNCPLEKVEINTTTIDTWFSRLTSIKEIIIGDSVTSIGSGAFQYCSGLTNVTIPNSVKSIGNSAFYNCPLEKVEINTTTIDTWFSGITSIKEIIIGNSVTSIGSSAFRDCSGLESVTVDSGNTVYDSREGCNAIIETATNTLIQGCKNTIIPNSVTSIGSSAFYGCTGLTSITIPNSVTTIGSSAFRDCSGLTSITIPNSVTTIDYAFSGCTGLEKVEINTTIIYSWFSGNTSIKEIIIGDSVTSIGSSAFYGCTGLTNVTIPNSVTSIGSSAFYGCTGLTNVTIPNSVTSIGNSAFENCTGLISITIPNSVTSIRNGAFYGTAWYNNQADGVVYAGKVLYEYKGTMPANTSITIKEGTLGIEERAFYECSGLASITIPNSVTSIGNQAFYKCTGLEKVEINTTTIYSWFSGITSIKEIIIGDSVTSIGSSAFYGCTGLTNVTIGNSVTSIGNSAFYGCTGITEIYIEATIPPSVSSRAFYNVPVSSIPVYVPAGSKTAYQAANTWKSFTNIVEMPGGICGDDATWILRDSTLTISGSGAMYNYTDSVAPWSTYRLEIKEVVVNDSVTTIGDGAFFSCTGLASVTIPNSVTTIENSAFEGCTGLTSITIPNSVTSIGDYAFCGCIGLTSVTIPNSVTSIGGSAFRGCTGLTSVTIPNSVTSIGDYAFYKCTGLTSVTIPNSVTTIENNAFNGCTGLTSITIPNSVTSIGGGAFYGCTGLTSVEIPNSVTSIGMNAFGGCSGLTSITIPNSVTSIEYYAFSGCTGLTSIEIPNSVTSIGGGAFSGCPLEKVEINTTTVGSWFKGCTSIKEIIIGDSVTTIGDDAFYKCTGLTSVTIGNSVTTIGDYAFFSCLGLTSVTIGNSVTTIGDYAFYKCTGLTSVAIPNSVTSIGNYAFQYSDLREIHIPASVTSIGDYAFTWNLNLQGITMDSGNKVYNIPANSNVVMRGDSVVFGWQGAVIPENAVAIGNGAFNSVSGITSITIPASVTSIGEWAFEACSDLTEIYCLSETPARIYSTTFQGLYDTVTLYVPAIGKNEYAGVSYWKKFTNIVLVGEIVVDGLSYAVISEEEKTVQVIGYSGSNEFVKIPSSITKNGNTYSVTSIGGRAFYGCTGLTGIEIPNSVTTMGDDAFRGCTSLTSVTIPNSVTSMGDYAFYNCTGLTSVTIPNSLTTIGESAFYGCTNLATVVNNSSLDIIAGSEDHGRVAYYADEVINNRGGSVIGDFVFNDSGNLIKYIGNESEITLPEKSPAGIKYGIVEAFQNNTKITSVIIPDSVSFIYNTFSGCTSLTSVTIGNGVHRIGEAAFQGCSALKDIYVNGIVPALLYSESFAEHYASATLHVPAGTKAAYQSSTSQREEMEIKILPVYNNDLLASMSGCDKDAIYETVKVEVQNPDVAGTLNGNDYLLAYQPLKTKMTDLPKATFETNIVHGGRYKIALVTAPWFIESYKDTLISSSFDPLYADSYLRVRVNQNNEQLAMFPCDSFNIGTSKTNFGVWEKHAIVPDRSRIDTIFLKDANNEDYIFDFVNGHSVGVNIELLRPLQYNERNGRYSSKNANAFAFRFLLDQIMLIPVDESTIVSTIYWKNFANIVEEANDLTGDIDGDGAIDVADVTTLVSMILDNSLASDAADVDGDGTVDVADVTSLISIILGTDTASAAPAKAAATRAGEASTVSADGDGETLLINITNPAYEFSAIQFDLDLPEGIEVAMDEEYYEVYLGSRAHRKHSDPECAVQADGSLRVVIMSLSNALFSGTEGDVATVLLKANSAADGEYPFTIKNVVISSTGKEILAPYTGWITVSGGVTGIDEIKEERAESNDIYDLQGRKVTEPVKGGIYIVNGKKVIW